MKFCDRPSLTVCEESPPVWGAWIEMTCFPQVLPRRLVAPRMGGVD